MLILICIISPLGTYTILVTYNYLECFQTGFKMIIQFVSVIIHEYEFLIYKIRDGCKEKLNRCSLILLTPHLNRSRAQSCVLANTVNYYSFKTLLVVFVNNSYSLYFRFHNSYFLLFFLNKIFFQIKNKHVPHKQQTYRIYNVFHSL